MRRAPVARSISTRTKVAHMAPKTVPKRLFSVGGNFTLERSRRAYLPPPLRTASASISALHVCPATGKIARDHPQREKACAMAPVTSLRAWALAAIEGNDSGAKPGISRCPSFQRAATRSAALRRSARRTRFVFIATQSIGSNGDDRNILEYRVRFDAARRLVTVEDRKLNVHQDEVWPLLRHRRQCLLAVLRLRPAAFLRARFVCPERILPQPRETRPTTPQAARSLRRYGGARRHRMSRTKSKRAAKPSGASAIRIT